MNSNKSINNATIFSTKLGVLLTITSSFVGAAFAMDYAGVVPYKHITPTILADFDLPEDKFSSSEQTVIEENFVSFDYPVDNTDLSFNTLAYQSEEILAESEFAVAELDTDSWIVVDYDHKDFGLDYIEVSDDIVDSVKAANLKTGVGVGYLLAVASRESSFRKSVKSSTSSAKGLFQMTNQTWSATMDKFGEQYGYVQEASSIRKNSSGRLYYTSNTAKKDILSMRDAPEHASLLSAALTLDNKRRVESVIGRSLKDYEVYMAHFFGVTNAAKFLKNVARRPNAYPSSYSRFNAARKANKNIFYNKRTGRERTFAQVYNEIKDDMERRIAFYSLSYAKISSDEHKEAREYLHKMVQN